MYLNYNRIMQETIIKVANLITVAHVYEHRHKHTQTTATFNSGKQNVVEA